MSLIHLVSPLIILFSACGAWASDASIRIGFLLNFSRFTNWPESALPPGAPINFCLAPGDAEMAAEFAMLERQTLRNRPLNSIQVARPADIARCHVLYLAADLPNGPAQWIASAERASTLTVSDRPDFIDEGGMIGLIMVAGRYRFDINLAQTKRKSLGLSADLLKLARSVK